MSAEVDASSGHDTWEEESAGVEDLRIQEEDGDEPCIVVQAHETIQFVEGDHGGYVLIVDSKRLSVLSVPCRSDLARMNIDYVHYHRYDATVKVEGSSKWANVYRCKRCPARIWMDDETYLAESTKGHDHPGDPIDVKRRLREQKAVNLIVNNPLVSRITSVLPHCRPEIDFPA